MLYKKRLEEIHKLHILQNITLRIFLLWDQLKAAFVARGSGTSFKNGVHQEAPVPLISPAARGRQVERNVLPKLQNNLCDVPHYLTLYTLCAFDVL